ncbi:hypothetical protein [Fodinibacter luteus]
MTVTPTRPAMVGRDRHHFAADAFLYAACIFLVAIGVQELLAYLVSGGEPGTLVTPPVWLELVGALAMPVAAIGGPLLAWRASGRTFGWRVLVAAVVGAVVGSALIGMAIIALVSVLRRLPGLFPEDEGPWELVVIAALAVVAFLAEPVVAAVRDLTGTRRHPGRDWLRLGIVAIGLAAVVASVVAGGESAELGLFLALPATAAACAAAAMDLWQSRRAQGSGPTAGVR